MKTGTAIAALIDKKNKITYIAADSQGSDSSIKGMYKNTKVFTNGIITFAGTGSYMDIQVLKYDLSPRRMIETETVEDYVYKYLVKEIKKVLKDNQRIVSDSNIESLESVFIIAVKDRIFILQSDLSILEPKDPYLADGSGRRHMQASIETQLVLKVEDYKEILKNALEITSKFVMSVGGESVIIEHKH